MATPQEILQGMIDDSEGQVETLESQLESLDAMIETYEDQAEAIEDGMLTPIANSLSSYIDSTKVYEIEIAHGDNVEVVYGPTYNNLADIDNATITDWKIIDSTSGNTVYAYNGAGWDNDPLITKWTGDWNWGHDYLTHPLTTFDGNYGIYPNITALSRGRSTLAGSKTKIGQSSDRLGDYV